MTQHKEAKAIKVRHCMDTRCPALTSDGGCMKAPTMKGKLAYKLVAELDACPWTDRPKELQR